MSIKHATFGFVCAAALAASVWGRTVAEDHTRKSFAVSEGGTLIIEADRGSIDVKTGANATVDIEVIRTIDRGSEAQAKKLLAAHVLTFHQDGNNISIKGELPGQWTSRWHGPNLSVKYILSIPRKYNADLRTAGGDITMAELDGEGHYRTSGGNVKIGKSSGPIFARSSGGNIMVAGCEKSVELETSGGNLKIGKVGGDVRARTSGGEIHLATVSGNVDIHTSGGNIQADELMGAAQASTSGGDVKARLARQPSGNCTFKTSGGNIELALADEVAIDLNAHSSGGSVKTDFPVTTEGKRKENSLQTRINGGGPSVVLQTSGGDVRIRKL